MGLSLLIPHHSFQQVQGLSALGASIRILPSLITAVLTNVSTGYFVNRMPVMWMVLIACGLSALSPVLMAVINPHWPYWYMAFFAQVSAKPYPSSSSNTTDAVTKSFSKAYVSMSCLQLVCLSSRRSFRRTHKLWEVLSLILARNWVRPLV